MKRRWFCVYSLNYVLVNSSNHYVLNNRYDTALDISNTKAGRHRQPANTNVSSVDILKKYGK